MSALPVIKGTLDVLALRALNLGPKHGFEIVEWLEQAAGGSLQIEDSALYQALYRLEERGYLKASWGVTANNRRARYYSITADGRKHLRNEAAVWLRYSQAVNRVLRAAPALA